MWQILLFCGFLGISNCQVDVWLSTGDSLIRLEQQSGIIAGPDRSVTTINTDATDRDQSIKGFGAALSNAAAWLIWNSSERDQVLRSLFDRDEGVGLSYIRLVMGGSDFNAVDPYTYDDADFDDYNQDEFTIDKDRDFVIPVLKEILNVNPDIKILASPWTAPAWMKNPNNMFGGALRGGDAIKQSLAEYFVKFIQAYDAEGITIDAVTLQNEPEHSTNGYPTMRMPWADQRDLIKFVGPRFQDEGISTDIVIWDHNWDQAFYPMNILNDPEAKQYVGGVAWHCYGGDRYDPQQVRDAHPDIDVYFTECSGGEWDTHFGSVLGWNTQNLFIGQTRVGARTVLLWNLALDENHGPRVGVNGGCSDCRGIVTIPSSGTFERNVEWYTLGHFSKFVRPGAERIFSTTYESDELETVAFQNTDGSIAVVILNAAWGDTTKTFQVEINGEFYYYENLPSRSVLTFIKQ